MDLVLRRRRRIVRDDVRARDDGEVEPDVFVAELVAAGWPPPDAEDYADAVAALRKGLDAHVSDGVRRALGRPPRDFAEFVATADWAR